MARKQLEARVRYDADTDSFVYELYDDDTDEYGLCMACKCVRREGAPEYEEPQYIHFSLLKKVVTDVYNYNVLVHMA